MAFPRIHARPSLSLLLSLSSALALAIACGDDASDDAAESAAATSAASATMTVATADDATAGSSPCGEMCGLYEVCIVDCACPPPGTCFQRPEIGDCGDGTLDVGGTNCCATSPDPTACMEIQWCRTGVCTPDLPVCVDEDDVSCGEDEEADACMVDGCSGQLADGVLTCEVCQ